MKLSLAIATFNEENKIEACLESIRDLVDEIILVDGGSTDNTVKIAKTFGAVITITDNPPIFHINKQKALDKCHGEWILQLDADEIVSPSLNREIFNIVSSKSSEYSGYYMPRKNFFLSHWLRKGGQYPDFVVRLFKRGKGTFPSKSVHEQIVIDGSVGYLKNPLLHYSSTNVEEYWRKANTYINLSTKELKNNKTPVHIVSFLDYMFFRPIFTFLLLFTRHKGFMDGIYGFLFALFSALHHPMSYWRYISNK